MPDIALNGISLHYEVNGSGPPLLLLAGMMGDHATWMPLVPLLEPYFTLIRPDNRTTGRTQLNGQPAQVALMADDAIALMTALGHDTFHVAGHSLGGLLSLEIAHHVPNRVHSVGVFASGRVRSPRTMAVFETLLALRNEPNGEDLWLRALYPWIFGQAFFETPENTELAIEAARAYPHAQTLSAMTQQVAAFRAFRPQAKLSAITCPTLILYADQDLLVPPNAARPSFADLPNKTEVTIPEAGHSIVWDATEKVAQAVLDFVPKNSA